MKPPLVFFIGWHKGTPTTFSYDGQNRLITGTEGLAYGYDAAGRLTRYEGASYTRYQGHAVTDVDGTARYRYGGNGNMETRQGQTLLWDRENHLQAVYGSGVDERYFYDADGQRVKKIVNGVATFYPNGLVEQTDGVVTKYYYFAGQRVAMRKDGVLTYLHGDHLGSMVLETDASGNGVGDERFLAFGKKRSGSGVGTDHGFTGQKQDASGLQYFNARYFDPQLGTFISPDNLVPDLHVTMDYNRYMAFRGNPLKYNDPSGHCVFAVIDSIICVVVGSALILSASIAEHHEPSQAEINSSRLGGALILGGIGGLLFTEARAGGMACAAASEKCEKALSIGEKAVHGGEEVVNSVVSDDRSRHILLGLQAHGLEDMAKEIGAEHLMGDNFVPRFNEALSDPTTRFSVSLDGVSGGSIYSKISSMIQKGAGGGLERSDNVTNWEMFRLYESGRIKEVVFYLAGQVVENPYLD